MAGVKISQLDELETLEAGDFLAAVDINGNLTGKIEKESLRDTLIEGAASTISADDLTTSRAVVSDAGGKIAAAATTLAELEGLNGLTASRAIATNGSGILTPATVTATELGHLSGVSGAIQAQIDAINTRPVINLIRNANMNFFDFATGAINDNDMFAAYWRYLSSVASGTFSQETTVPTGSRYSARLNAVGAGHFVGAFQVIPADDAIPLRDKTVSLSAWVRNAGTEDYTLINAVIATFTGSADATTGDPISSWSSTPTWAANWTQEGIGSAILDPGSVYTQLILENVDLDTASFNNIGVLIFSEHNDHGSGSQTMQFYLAQVQLTVGNQVFDFVHRPVQSDRILASKNNVAVGAPGTGDDVIDGYGYFSEWLDIGGGDHYICIDPTAGAAVWKKTTP